MSDVRACGSCLHWDQQGPSTEWRMEISLKPLPGHGPAWEDERTAERQRDAENLYGECQAIDLIGGHDELDAAAGLPLAFCRDGSDYKASLYTRAVFGCALWVRRPDDASPNAG